MVDQPRTPCPSRPRGRPRGPATPFFDRRVSRRDVLKVMGLGASGRHRRLYATTATPAPTAAANGSRHCRPDGGPDRRSDGGPDRCADGGSHGRPATAAPTARAAPRPVAASAASTPRGGTIRAGAFEGGLTDGWLTWKSFGQEFAWNWCAQRLLSIAPDGIDRLRPGQEPHRQRGRPDYTFVARRRARGTTARR